MAYHRQQGVDTAIVRIFNSILADEQVLYDDGTELRREPVEQAAARLLPYAFAAGYVPRACLPQGAGSTATALRPALEYPLDGVQRAGLRPRRTPAGRARRTHLIAHPTDARCFEVRTRYGRSIRVTGDHSIFVEGPGRGARTPARSRSSRSATESRSPGGSRCPSAIAAQ